jgi:hypothetical protein
MNMSDSVTTCWHRNPDGPEAAAIIKELVEALEPFAAEANRRPRISDTPAIAEWPIGGSALTNADLLRARAALSRAQVQP